VPVHDANGDERAHAVRRRFGGGRPDRGSPLSRRRPVDRDGRRARSARKRRPRVRPAGGRACTAVDSGAADRTRAIVCFCEDVRAWEIRAEQAAGYRDPELIKRRTGALTGPCQGKQCLQAFACLTARLAARTGRSRPVAPAAPGPPR
jgi:hypothetical protein